MRRALALSLCLSLLPLGASASEPSPAETAFGSIVGYVGGGLPPVILAVVGVSCGWTLPVVATFAFGGAAYSLLDVAETPRIEQVPAVIRAASGAVRGVIFFPAMMGFAGRKVYAPLLAQAIHDWRAR